VSAPSWVGILAPPKTPQNIVTTLAKAFIDTMNNPEVAKS